MKRQILPLTLLIALGLMACKDQSPAHAKAQEVSLTTKTHPMNNFISLFEIPATDVPRAIQFYETLLDIKIEKMDMPGMEMGIFPYENQAVPGVIMKDGDLKPSADGVTLYLNAGDDLQPMLDKVEAQGGQIISPKTAHADESGFFALILDSEGNKIGLNSPN